MANAPDMPGVSLDEMHERNFVTAFEKVAQKTGIRPFIELAFDSPDQHRQWIRSCAQDTLVVAFGTAVVDIVPGRPLAHTFFFQLSGHAQDLLLVLEQPALAIEAAAVTGKRSVGANRQQACRTAWRAAGRRLAIPAAGAGAYNSILDQRWT